MNNINTEQNKEEILLLLFSQKTLYNKAKNYKYIIIFMAIVNFLLGIVNKITSLYEVQISIIITLIILICEYLKSKSSKFNDLAAATQELIDRKLYGFEIKNRFLGNHSNSQIESTATDLKEKYHSKYIENIQNCGTDEPNGVKNWYIEINPSLPIDKAILKCQNQNIYWDERLIRYYRNLLNLLCITIGIIFLILYWNKGVKAFFMGALSSYTIFMILIKELYSANKFINYNRYIDAMICTSNILEVINQEFLEELQSKIFLRRKSCFNVPSFIHKIYSKKLHSKYDIDN